MTLSKEDKIAFGLGALIGLLGGGFALLFVGAPLWALPVLIVSCGVLTVLTP